MAKINNIVTIKTIDKSKPITTYPTRDVNFFLTFAKPMNTSWSEVRINLDSLNAIRGYGANGAQLAPMDTNCQGLRDSNNVWFDEYVFGKKSVFGTKIKNPVKGGYDWKFIMPNKSINKKMIDTVSEASLSNKVYKPAYVPVTEIAKSLRAFSFIPTKR